MQILINNTKVLHKPFGKANIQIFQAVDCIFILKYWSTGLVVKTLIIREKNYLFYESVFKTEYFFQKAKVKRLSLNFEKEKQELQEKSHKEQVSLKDQLQVHIQTIGILVAEKTELQSSLSLSQQTAKQKAGICLLFWFKLLIICNTIYNHKRVKKLFLSIYVQYSYF